MMDVFVAKPTQKTASTPLAPSVQQKPINQKPIIDSLSEEVGEIKSFTSYSPNPANVSFNIQENGEQVILFLRRHGVTNISWITSGILLLFIPPIVIVLFHINNPFAFFFPQPLPSRYLMVMTLFYYLIIAVFVFTRYVTWFYNISLVTTVRLFDLDFSGIVQKHVSAAKLSHIEDVSALQVGPLRSLFDYGDVSVQTQGTLDNFIFEAIPHPTQAVNIIEKLMERQPSHD